MPTSVAISSAALVQSSIAADQARRAHEAACHAFIPTYSHNVESMKFYADCIQLLYPSDSGPWMKYATAFLLVSALAGLLIQAWRWLIQSDDTGPMEVFFLGPFIGLSVSFIIVLIILAVAFVFS